MCDHAAVLLSCAGQEPRYIHERNDGDVERVTEADEPSGFARCVDVEHASQELGLVRDDTYRLAVKTGKSHDDILRVIACTSRNSPLSTIPPITWYISYGLLGLFGIIFV